MMKIGLNLWPFNDIPLEKVLKFASRVGYEAVEIAVDTGRDNHLKLDYILSGGASSFKKMIGKYGLELSALSCHIDSQLIGGPYTVETDTIFKGSPEEKMKYGFERVKKAVEVAAALDVDVINGFVGCENFSSWFPWPGGVHLWEEGYKKIVERWNPVLDVFGAHGVKFAHEPFPQQQAYNIETSEALLKAFNMRKEFGFNLDPANLLWCLVDPVIFVKKLGERIFSVHAKDGELVEENLSYSGSVATGDWKRFDRGFRFRVVGWGQIDWKRLITALVMVKYNGVLSVEHEDPWLNRTDGCKKAINYLKPLLPELEEEWARGTP
jgi:sugar phosphate isomerase/epimerase